MKKYICALLFLISGSIVFSQKEITGTVKDSNEEPLIGVTISVVGIEGIRNITDINGNFSISVPDNATRILFSYIGYFPEEVSIVDSSILDVIMQLDTKSLDEVVVVAFGEQKKQSVVGSQSSVRPELLKTPVRSLSTAIAGRLSGVVATQRGGGPGADDATLFIRGVGTFASSPQSPLLVVDGVPDRDINNIDPEDIESFTVLKDATATAVYGTRGANGVILIETKGGRPGKPKINLELNRGVTRFTELPGFVDGPTFMQLFNEGLTMRGRNPLYSDEEISFHREGVDSDLYPNVNWYDEIFKNTGSSEKINLNIRGGSEDASYYISAGYFGETGLFKRDDIQTFNSTLKLNRFNFTSNVDVNIGPTASLEFGVNGYISNLNRPSAGVNNIFALATNSAPHVVPTQYSNGEWPLLRGTTRNPYMQLTQTGVTEQYNNVVRSNLKAIKSFDKLVPGLRLHGMFAFDVFTENSLTRSRNLQTYYATGRDSEGNLLTDITETGTNDLSFNLSRFGDRRYYFEFGLNYAKSIKEHEFSGLLLVNQSDFSDATARVSSYQAAIPYRQRNLVGRINYGFKDKYFAEANFSNSGSDNFIPSERYGFFPSFGAGWLMSNEEFFEPLSSVVSYMKLRYSYGLSGNASVNDPNNRFLYLTTIGNSGGYTFGTPGSTRTYTGYNESRIGGNVKWETSYRQNLGIEANFLNDDLELIVELFKERREGILLRNYVVPYATGFTIGNIPFANIGETENKGLDITLDYNHFWNGNDFINFRGTFNTNRNLAVNDGLPPWRYPYLDRIGQAIGQRFGYISQGLFESDIQIENAAAQAGDVRVGDIRYKDLNGDGIINQNDQTAIGFGDTPRIVYGLSLGGGYGGFDISMFFQGVGKVDFNYAGGFATIPFSQGATYGNLYTEALDRWQEDGSNPDPLYPRLSTNQDATTNYYTSDWWIRRADYLRLKQAEVGYNFNKNGFLDKYGVEKIRLYGNGTNLLTFSPWEFWDPELGDGRGTNYPNTTTFNIGLRINFK